MIEIKRCEFCGSISIYGITRVHPDGARDETSVCGRHLQAIREEAARRSIPLRDNASLGHVARAGFAKVVGSLPLLILLIVVAVFGWGALGLYLGWLFDFADKARAGAAILEGIS